MNPATRRSTSRGFPLREAALHLPLRNGKRIHYSTLYRWATKGSRGRVLETMLVGGVRFTTLEALQRFLVAGTNTASAVANKGHDAIGAALDEAGV